MGFDRRSHQSPAEEACSKLAAGRGPLRVKTHRQLGVPWFSQARRKLRSGNFRCRGYSGCALKPRPSPDSTLRSYSTETAIERVLNHVSGAQGGLVSVYQRHEYRGGGAAAGDPGIALVGGTPRQVQSRKPKQEATSGTAFFVSDDGDALTNAHVVEDCQQIRVAGAAAQLIARDSPNDLALLKTQLHPAQWANWRQSVKLGEDIVAYGFPLAGRLSSSGNVVTGNVTALVGLGDDSRFLQISAPIQPGNSGGPLFDRNGSVVGVVVAKLNAVKIASETGDIPQNVNFAIKSSVAVAFLDAHRVPHSENDAPPLPLSTPEIATQAQALTAQVLCTQ